MGMEGGCFDMGVLTSQVANYPTVTQYLSQFAIIHVSVNIECGLGNF